MSTATLHPSDAVPPLSEFDGRHEVVGAEIVEKPPTGAFEATLASFLFEAIGPFARAHGLGQFCVETLFDLRPSVDRSRRPDLAFVSAARWPLHRRAPRGEEAWRLVPDLAIEVISPTNTASSDLEKVVEYLQAGVRAVWVVYSLEAEIHIFEADAPSVVRRLRRGDVLDAGPVVPGFRLDLGELFVEEA
jgi:Uma2 family endonuclease